MNMQASGAPPPAVVTTAPFDMLTCVEQFILPSTFKRLTDSTSTGRLGSPSHNGSPKSKVPPSSSAGNATTNSDWLGQLQFKLTPRQRLEHTCIQVCLAEHIRTLQTMYRDPDDELQVCLSMRSSGFQGIKLPTKLLQDRVLEGQIRIIALSRLCYGDHSIEYIRARNDLSGSYAQQGLWAQAKEIVDESHNALQRMIELPSLREQYFAVTKKAKLASSIVLTTFQRLRAHAAAHYGHITVDIIRELVSEFGKMPLLVNATPTATKGVTLGDLATPSDDRASQLLELSTRLISSLHDFISAHETKHGAGKCPSWGQTIDYLRMDNAAMIELFAAVEDAMLPQYRAAILLSFQQCDQLQKRIAQTIQLSQLFHRIHNTSRAIASCNISKYLTQLKTEVNLLIDSDQQCVANVAACFQYQQANSRLFNYQSQTAQSTALTPVVYELPIAYEEVLSYIIQEQCVDAVEFEMSHVLTLKGIVQIFSGHLSESELTIRDALRYLEQQGLEMEVVSCELYNTIAQLMIVKFRQAEHKKKISIKKAAMAWLLTEQGRKELRDQMKLIRAHYMNKNMIVISAAESELKARNFLLKQKMKEIKKFAIYDENGEFALPMKMVDAAYRYVVRSYDILESIYGATHICVVTACLAVASVLSMSEKYSDSREWLSRALRSMEKLDPVPVRSIAYAQIQLSKVLQEGQFVDESITVLGRAVMFYSTTATQRLQYMISSANSTTASGPSPAAAGTTGAGANTASGAAFVGTSAAATHATLLSVQIYRGKPHPQGQQPYEDVEQALELGSQLIKLQVDKGNLWPAAEQAEVLAELAELAYGWDSPESGEWRKQAAERFVAIKDYGKAVIHYKHCLDTLESIFEKCDPRCLEIVKLIQRLNDERVAELDGGDGTSPVGKHKKGRNNQGKAAHSFTERLRAAWKVPSTDLIRTTMELGEDGEGGEALLDAEAVNMGSFMQDETHLMTSSGLQLGARGRQQQANNIIVGNEPEDHLIAKYHTDLGLVGLKEDINTFDMTETFQQQQQTNPNTFPNDNQKRLQRQPKQVKPANYGNGPNAPAQFQYDDDLEL